MTLLKSFRIALFFSISFLLFSCSQNKNSELSDNEIKFDSISIRKQKHLFNDTSKAKAQIEINLLTPNSATPEKIKALIESCFKTSYFGNNNPKISIEKMAQAYVSNYLKEYNQLESIFMKDKEEFSRKKVTNDDDADLYEPMQSAYNYEHTTNVDITFNKANIISYVVKRYDYTGGAHGMTTDSCFTILLDKERFLKQEDLFDESALDQIAALIIKKIAKDNAVEDPIKLEELGFFSVKEIYPNGNIHATDKGITWTYNPYDIAAYAIGSVKVTIPFEDLKPLLKANHPLLALVK